jgi:acetate kinase
MHSIDDECIKRIDQNLGVAQESKIDEHLNESIKTCFKKLSTEVKINAFTKIKDGKLKVIVVQDEFKDGVLVNRKVLQDWSEVVINPKEEDYHQSVMGRND